MKRLDCRVKEESVSARHIVERLGTISRPVIWAVQAVIFAVSGITAFLLRFDLSFPPKEVAHLVYALPVWIVMKIIVFRIARLDQGWWRFVSLHDLPRLAMGNLLGSFLGTLAILWLAPRGFPRSIYVLDLLVCSLLAIGVRLAARIFFEASKFNALADKKRMLIYGAGAAGVSLLVEIRNNEGLPYQMIGFIDDDPKKAGLVIHGAKVLGNGEKLAATVRKHRVDTVLIAIPSAAGEQMTHILRRCQRADVSYKTVPSLGEIIEGNGLAKQVRDVAVEDLLGRNPVRLEEDQIRGTLEGKVVLVTGAAGSIGSELCRQIARFHPAGIVGFEIAESPLFEIDREMRQAFPTIPFYPEIGQHTESHPPGRGPAPVLALDRLSRRRLQARPHDGGARL